MDEFRMKMELNLKELKEKAKERQEYNIKCINLIRDFALKFPELRFGQILHILDLDKDWFNEESVDTYKKIKGKLTC